MKTGFLEFKLVPFLFWDLGFDRGSNKEPLIRSFYYESVRQVMSKSLNFNPIKNKLDILDRLSRKSQEAIRNVNTSFDLAI